MFCHSSVDHAAISVTPVAQSVGCVKIVVKTSGSPVVVDVDDDDRFDTIDDDSVDEADSEGVEAVVLDGAGGVDVVFVRPGVKMLMVCSWPEARETAPKASNTDRKTDGIVFPDLFQG